MTGTLRWRLCASDEKGRQHILQPHTPDQFRFYISDITRGGRTAVAETASPGGWGLDEAVSLRVFRKKASLLGGQILAVWQGHRSGSLNLTNERAFAAILFSSAVPNEAVKASKMVCRHAA